MNIVLVEICERFHYMVTHALIKTYSSSKENSLLVFIGEDIYENLKDDEHLPNVKFVIKNSNESTLDFFKKINSYSFDRIHYCTISKYYDEFIQILPKKNVEVFFHFHNIDLWFHNIVKV